MQHGSLDIHYISLAAFFFFFFNIRSTQDANGKVGIFRDRIIAPNASISERQFWYIDDFYRSVLLH